MHFYAMSFDEIRRVPIYTFWEMARNVDRLRAEEDMRFYKAVTQAVWAEDAEPYLDSLKSDLGLNPDNCEEVDASDRTEHERVRAMIMGGRICGKQQ